MMKKLLVIVCVVLMTAGLFGCSGSSDNKEEEERLDPVSSILKGTAATGKAIIGIVHIKDSLGVIKQADLDAKGNYEIDLAGMTGPFILRAEGRVGTTEVTVHSMATTADLGGNINVTPITDLIVANLA